MPDLTWRKAIETVLEDAGGSMHYKDIADEIVSRGLRESVGATPAATVSANLTTSIGKSGDSSPFQKTGRGEYMLRSQKTKPQNAGTSAHADRPEKEETEDQYEIISSFGMFWRRDFVDWNSSPKLLGMQQIGAEAVNFYEQVGIYLLYDGREIIYVGRSTDRPLGKRLYEHTADRLATRWDRFSWFGLLPVSEKGKLGKLPSAYIANKIAPALEAVLIEALEPRQNRKRGDDLSAVEYLQKEDPEISRKKQVALLERLASKV
ncbi:HTH domain-containing protein [Halomonas piscis]|uniref:HTH domain-containing protein n=1 Tax=Halomonas piscis TaxID=3031727 RepID=UPI002899DC50|nr:HTH domain-containing protein [Halomonas piscis]